ncbi:hypothetical protein DMH15_33435 [Streptomyces sp. WAC 06725]|uniref:NUDIX domain-containing protein n=1 Tax=Streptomyces sp. WAC 06725 TaxID=2203209 RepID=UPI001001A4ED|nr:NUDIX domain-containing protein [Streptomyces sp. WAC 06725]RSO22330.1 hypothetical protein DMH15_33435 [Streptomyces sp. WAC 06725]
MVLVVVEDEAKMVTDVLVIDPDYTDPRGEYPGWLLPGGAQGADERILEAAERKLEAETGLVRKITKIIAIDEIPENPETGVPAGVNYVCDGGTLSLEDAEALRLPAASERIKGVKVVPFYDLGDYAKPYQARRIRAAVVNRCAGRYLTPLIKGEPAAEPAD